MGGNYNEIILLENFNNGKTTLQGKGNYTLILEVKENWNEYKV